MRKRKLTYVLAVLLALMVLTVFSACDNGGTDSSGAEDSVTEAQEKTAAEEKALKEISVKYEGKKIGVPNGSTFDVITEKYIQNAEIVYYKSITDMALALKAGKISGYAADKPAAQFVCESYRDQHIAGIFEKCPCAYIYPKDTEKSDKLRSQMNEFLEKIKKDGTLDEIAEIWFGTEESKKTVDMDSLTGENGTLKFSIASAAGAPIAYVKDNRYVGYDVDIAVRFCKEYGYGIDITDYNLSGFFTSVSTGQADFGGSSVCITEERKEELDFSDPNYNGGVVFVTKDDGKSGEKASDDKGFFESLKNSFNKTFIKESRWKLFLKGLCVTLFLTILSAAFGTLLGFGLFLIYRKENKIFNRITDAVSSFLQMTPVVVILMIFYYLIFADAGFSGIAVAITAFSILFACSVLNLFRSSVQAVDKGQTDAVMALGYRDTKGFIRMILPQAIPHFIPGYRSGLVSLIKDTAIVGYIAVKDLTLVTDIVRARTYEAFFPLVATAVIYFLFAFLLVKIVKGIEIKTDMKRRKEKRILKGVKRK